jgi:type II secretion system protein H
MSARRHAFTLLEVMIVLAIVVSMMAIAWPRMRGMAAQTELREAAVEFKAACAQARQQAARTGNPVFLHYAWGQRQYQLGDRLATEADASDVIEIQSPETEELDAGDWDRSEGPDSDGPDSDRAKGADSVDWPRYELPMGMEFADPASPQSTDDSWQFDPVDELAVSDETKSIAFFPDGRCESADVRIRASDNGDSITLTLRGLTGGVSIAAVEKHREPNTDDESVLAPEVTRSVDVR